jgi:hypothetical protein
MEKVVSDIVELLRNEMKHSDELCYEAANEIEKLRKSLHKIMRTAKNKSTHAWDSHAEYWRIAKAGLGEEQ